MRMIKPMMMMMTKKEGETHITIWTVRSASGQPTIITRGDSNSPEIYLLLAEEAPATTIYRQSPGKDYTEDQIMLRTRLR